MSRIGKQLISVPKGVEVTTSGKVLKVKGPKGTLERELPPTISVVESDGHLEVLAEGDSPDVRRLHGLYRALIQSMVTGVATGHQKVLELIGVGYRAAVKGTKVDLQLGFSHPTEMEIPQGVTVNVEKNTLVTVDGPDAQVVGQFAADMRRKRPPEPYKGKGVRYRDEYVRRKAGKAGKK
jgi:large subunit ribosomal protein L6